MKKKYSKKRIRKHRKNPDYGRINFNFFPKIFDLSHFFEILYEAYIHTDKYKLTEAIIYRIQGDLCEDCDEAYYDCRCERCEDCKYSRCLCDLPESPYKYENKIKLEILKFAKNSLSESHFKMFINYMRAKIAEQIRLQFLQHPDMNLFLELVYLIS